MKRVTFTPKRTRNIKQKYVIYSARLSINYSGFLYAEGHRRMGIKETY